jgi:hypothetical protein
MDKRVYQFTAVNVHAESRKAWHCQIVNSMFWVPKSQIESFDIGMGELVTTMWWAEVSGAKEAFESRRVFEPRVDMGKSMSIYRKLAFKYHPDRNPGSAEVMRDLNELWQSVVSDLMSLNKK